MLVAPEGGGLVDLTKSIARRLAEAGYAAFAMDYYGDGKPLADMNEVMPRIKAFMAEPATIRARAAEALAVLARQPECDAGRLAAIGYCFGGTTVLELARSGADLKAVVGFHSGLGTSRAAGRQGDQGQGPDLHRLARPDHPGGPAPGLRDGDDRRRRRLADERLRRGGPQLHQSGRRRLGRPGFEYHAETDRRSWAAMLDLFDETLGTPA